MEFSPVEHDPPSSPGPGREHLSTDELLPKIYLELRNLAASRLANELPGNTLTPTALVHEVYLRLKKSGADAGWESTAHFFGSAAKCMRRILIDNARRKLSAKRGAELQRIEISLPELPLDLTENHAEALLDLDECLKQFSMEYPLEAELVQLRFFAGLTMTEAAQILGITKRTAQRHWAFAKARISQRVNRGLLD